MLLKKDLEDKLVELETKLLEAEQKLKEQEANAKEAKIALKQREELIQEVFDKEKELQRTKETKDIEIKQNQKQLFDKIKENQELGQRFNELAQLFDEYIKSTDDIIELGKLFLRNNLRTQELMAQKIKAFNGQGEDKK